MWRYIKWKAKGLFPAYFAMVMTAGALSIGAYLLGFVVFAKVLLVINIFAYAVLWILTLIRLFNYFPRLKRDITSHEKGPGFFTLVAGTCVFGSQIYTVAENEIIPLFCGSWEFYYGLR